MKEKEDKMKRSIKTIGVIGAFLFIISSAYAGLINGKNGIALAGYDVVAYFEQFKKKKKQGIKGISKHASKYKGATYHFSSQENKEIFDKDPKKYIPTYGGWCAWAMANKSTRVSVDYDTFIIAENAEGEERLYLFYNSWGNNTLTKWSKGKHKELVSKADGAWEKELEKAKKEKEEKKK